MGQPESSRWLTKHRNLGWKAQRKKQNPNLTATPQLCTSAMGRLPRYDRTTDNILERSTNGA